MKTLETQKPVTITDRAVSLLQSYSHVNWALADQAMVSGVNFLTGILFARYLGIAEYGKFTLVWMAVLFCNGFQQAGIIAPMMSIGPKQHPNEEPAYYGAVFVQQVVWSTLCSLLLASGVLLSDFIKPEWQIRGLALPLATTLFAWQMQDFLRRYFFVRNLGGKAFFNDALSYLGQLVALLILFQLAPLNTERVLWLIGATSAFAVIVGIFKLGHLVVQREKLIQVINKHWRFSKWMLASVIMQWVSGNFYFVAAGAVLGPVAVGGIKAAQNIIGVTHILFQAMENFAPAGATRALTQQGIAGLKSYLKGLTFFGTAATGSVALFAWCFPVFFLTTFYGHDFEGFATILRWFCAVYITTFLTMPLTNGLRALEKTSSLFTAHFTAGLLSLISAFPLVKIFAEHGIMAGLWGSRIAMILILFVALRKVMEHEMEGSC
ncbi:MAG: hypothetical protein OEY01_16675 [Desulfobulbaceae bacterium]|nr:hypothetical protein [Desulfobulbaceae bacterium]